MENNFYKERDDRNVLFAEFLGWKKQNAGKWIIPDVLLKDHLYADLRNDYELEFHSNYNWLMLVVEKIETTRFDITQTKRYLKTPHIFNDTKMLGCVVTFYDDCEENKGWSYAISFDQFPMISLGGSGGLRYETKKECLIISCLDFVKRWKNNFK